jgi:hypothetical protein
MGATCLRNLVDLVGFEPTTSSMPFKEYQSLTDIAPENTRLSGGPFGRHGGFFTIWTPPGLRDSQSVDWHCACSFARGCQPL